MTDLVFLDIETTGLDPALHEVWEIATAVNDGPVVSWYVRHDIRTANPMALKLNGYFDRCPIRTLSDFGIKADLELRELLTGATVVGANPAFDTSFLRARWGVAPWHHRLIDVESMALALFGYDRPKGLAGLSDDLRSRGHDGIPTPDHTAAGDVATTRAVFDAMRSEVGL